MRNKPDRAGRREIDAFGVARRVKAPFPSPLENKKVIKIRPRKKTKTAISHGHRVGITAQSPTMASSIPHMSILILAEPAQARHLAAVGSVLVRHYGHRVRFASTPVHRAFAEANGLEFMPVLMAALPGVGDAGNEGALGGAVVTRISSPSSGPRQSSTASQLRSLVSAWKAAGQGGRRFSRGSFGTSGRKSKPKASSGRKSSRKMSGGRRPHGGVTLRGAGESEPPPPPPFPGKQPQDTPTAQSMRKSQSTRSDFQPDLLIASPGAIAHIHIAEKLRIPLHVMSSEPWLPTAAFRHPDRTRPVQEQLSLGPTGTSTSITSNGNVLKGSLVLKEGYLDKKRKSISSILGFRRQYFWILDRHDTDGKKERYWLAYDDDCESSTPDQIVSLSDCRIAILSKGLIFRLCTSKRNYLLRGKDKNDTLSWVRALEALQPPKPVSKNLKKRETVLMRIAASASGGNQRRASMTHALASELLTRIRAESIEAQDVAHMLTDRDQRTAMAQRVSSRYPSGKRHVPALMPPRLKSPETPPSPRTGAAIWDSLDGLSPRLSSSSLSYPTSPGASPGASSGAGYATTPSSGSQRSHGSNSDVPFTERNDVKVVLCGFLEKRRKGVMALTHRTQYFWLLRKLCHRTSHPRDSSSHARESSAGSYLDDMDSDDWEGIGATSPRFEYYLAYDDTHTTLRPQHVIPLSTSKVIPCGSDPAHPTSFVLQTSKRSYELRAAKSTSKCNESRADAATGLTHWIRALQKLQQLRSGAAESIEGSTSGGCIGGGSPTGSPFVPIASPRGLRSSGGAFQSARRSVGGRKNPKRGANSYFDDFIVLREGYLERKSQNVFRSNSYQRRYAWVYVRRSNATSHAESLGVGDSISTMTHGHAPECYLGLGPGPTMKKPKNVTPLLSCEVEHNFIKGYFRVVTGKGIEFKFRGVSEDDERGWVQIFTKLSVTLTEARKSKHGLGHTNALSTSLQTTSASMPGLALTSGSSSGLLNIQSAEASANMRSYRSVCRVMAKSCSPAIHEFRRFLGLSRLMTEREIHLKLVAPARVVPATGLWDSKLIPASMEWVRCDHSGGDGKDSKNGCGPVTGLCHVDSPVKPIKGRQEREALREWLKLSADPVVFIIPDAKALGSIDKGRLMEHLLDVAHELRIRLLVTSADAKNAAHTQQDTLMEIFDSDRGRALLMDFLIKEMSDENLRFLESKNQWEDAFTSSNSTKCRHDAAHIYATYIRSGAERQVNLSDSCRNAVSAALEASGPLRVNLFSGAASEVKRMMQRDSVLRFKKTQKYRDFVISEHGEDETTRVREVDPDAVDLKWLCGQEHVAGVILHGSRADICTMISMAMPMLLLTTEPRHDFWARAFAQTKAVVALRAKGARRRALESALRQLINPATKSAAKIASAKTRPQAMDSACLRAAVRVHKCLDLDRIRCRILPHRIARYWADSLSCPISLCALHVLVTHAEKLGISPSDLKLSQYRVDPFRPNAQLIGEPIFRVPSASDLARMLAARGGGKTSTVANDEERRAVLSAMKRRWTNV